uniref:carboxypeptidase-like regulatory domain-containing protein n=1 Tax=Pedobacter sp. TaxID=1411316 RepID=UPI003D7F8869
MKNIYYSLLLLLGFVNSAYAQDYTLTGQIKDQNGEPIPFTSVYVKNTTMGTSANVDGIYKLALAKGTY